MSQLPYSATTGCEEPTNWRFLCWTPNAWILLGRLLVAGKGCEIFIHPRLQILQACFDLARHGDAESHSREGDHVLIPGWEKVTVRATLQESRHSEPV